MASPYEAMAAATQAYHQTLGSSAKSYQGPGDPLTGPVQLDNSYQPFDFITGRTAAKQQAQNQAYLDYAEFARNQASAREQRDWEEYMSNTQVQRAMNDIKAAGLNPWLAVQSAGFGGAIPQGAVATSSAGQVAGQGGISSPGSILTGTAFGIAAMIKILKKVIK